MTTVDILTAQRQLELLAEAADAGEEVIITRPDGSAFRLVPLPMAIPKFGSAAGLIHMSDDFDEPLDEFEDYYR